MGTIVAVVSVVLAIFTAACIAYIAWELTSEETPTESADEDGPPDKQ